MTMKIVRTGDNPVTLGVGQPHYVPVTLYVTASGGVVTIEQFDEAADAWILPSDPENNIDIDGNIQIERSNRPGLRITATAGAVFTFYGDII